MPGGGERQASETSEFLGIGERFRGKSFQPGCTSFGAKLEARKAFCDFPARAVTHSESEITSQAPEVVERSKLTFIDRNVN